MCQKILYWVYMIRIKVLAPILEDYDATWVIRFYILPSWVYDLQTNQKNNMSDYDFLMRISQTNNEIMGLTVLLPVLKVSDAGFGCHNYPKINTLLCATL